MYLQHYYVIQLFDVLDDFERSMGLPHLRLPYPMSLITDLQEPRIIAAEQQQQVKPTEETKQQQERGQTQLSTQQQPGILSRFDFVNAPVDIRVDVSEDKNNVNINAELAGL